MQRSAFPAFLAAAIVIGTAIAAGSAAAQAQDPSNLNAKIASALSGAGSYRVSLSWPDITTATTVVHPDRARSISVEPNGRTVDILAIGATLWYRNDGGAWMTRSLDGNPAQNVATSYLDLSGKLELLQDRIENGVTVGAFQTNVPRPAAPGATPFEGSPTMCTYDKTTFRPLTCTVQAHFPKRFAPIPVVLTYRGWNDPTNVIEAPQGAIAAPAGLTPVRY